MIRPLLRHRWNLTPTAAIQLQKRLAALVLETPLKRPPRLVAGGDVAFSPDGTELIAAWIVWDVHHRRCIETVDVRRPVRFPYVPGLLSFRESPALLAAARKLTTQPDAFMIDGQGRAHPRRMGIACHVGLWLDRVTIGCGKTRLCGAHDTPAQTAGAAKPLRDGDEIIGRVVRTQDDTAPLFVSIGHRIDLMGAVRVVLACCTDYRIPEPTRLAHHHVTRISRTLWPRKKNGLTTGRSPVR